ncbi:MAG: DUF2723 domain-containing protein [Chloroflexota bacterium]
MTQRLLAAAERFGGSLVVGVITFVLLRLTMLPGVGTWDTAEYQAVGPLLGTAHSPGYPTYTIIGWIASIVLQPFGDPAARMNLLAVLCIAVGAAITVDLVRALTRSVWLGMAAGLGLALLPITWRIGLHAESHALHVVFVAALLRLLVAWQERHAADDPRGDRWLVAAAGLFGVSLGNHSLTLLLAPGIGLFLLMVEPGIWRRVRFVATCALALIGATVLVHLELPLRAGPFPAPLVYANPATWDGFWYVVLAQQFHSWLIGPLDDLGGKFARLVALTTAQLGPLGVLVPIAFVISAVRRRPYAVLTGVSVFITCFFSASYQNADISRYYVVPALMVWTWLAILAGAVVDSVSELGPRVRPAAIAALAAIILVAPTVIAIPNRRVVLDESRMTFGQEWLDQTLDRLEPNAVVVSWWSFSTPLWYAQRVEHRRPDITIIDDRTRLDQNLGEVSSIIDSYLGKRPVYVIRVEPQEIAGIEDRYETQPLVYSPPDWLRRIVRRNGA